MTEEFAEIVNRLAKARNFEDGAFLLITKGGGDETIKIESKGSTYDVLYGVSAYLDKLLSKMTGTEAEATRQLLKNVIIRDEQRRFQCDTEEAEK